MSNQSFEYKSSTLSYLQFGNGATPVLIFYGYDEQGSTYQFLEKFAGDAYTFYTVDMPFHGNTIWKEKGRLKPAIFDDLIKSFMASRQHSRPWQLVGFSLGGRIALGLYQQSPQLYQRVLLLAPDGLKLNFWYWLSTQTLLGNLFFKAMTAIPFIPRTIMALLGKVGVLNESLVRFCNYYLLNRERSKTLYQRWTGLSLIKPNLTLIQSQIIEHNTRFTLIYGKFDRIIKPNAGQRFASGTNNLATVTIIEAGHMLFKEKTMTVILESFEKNS